MCSTGTGFDTTSQFARVEDYELWSRLLDVADGDNLLEPLVLYRVHPDQASQRRRATAARVPASRGAQGDRRCGAGAVTPREQELAWRVGVAESIAPGDAEAAAAAYLELVSAFERRVGAGGRARAARDLMRVARAISGAASARLASHALRLDPALPAHVARVAAAIAVVRARLVVKPRPGCAGSRPTPTRRRFESPRCFRSPRRTGRPLLDRVAALSEIDLTVVYAAETVVRRTWRVRPSIARCILRGMRMPGADRLVRHDYPITPGVVGALERVASGRRGGLRLEHVRGAGRDRMVTAQERSVRPRGGEPRRRAAVGLAADGERAPSSLRSSRVHRAILVTGTLARDSMIARGRRTGARARLREHGGRRGLRSASGSSRRPAAGALRSDLGAEGDDVVVLSVARLAPEKRPRRSGARGARSRTDPRLLLVLAGEGGERPRRGTARQRARRTTRAHRRRRLGADRRALRRGRRVRASLRARAVGGRRERGGGVRSPARALGSRRCRTRSAARRGERCARRCRRRRRGRTCAAGARCRPGAASGAGRAFTGARADWGYGPSVDGFLETVREAMDDRALAWPRCRQRTQADSRPEPVLLARRRGDRAPADRALRGARGGLRGRGRHGGPARPRGRAAADRAQRRRHHPRRVDVVRALGARAGVP